MVKYGISVTLLQQFLQKDKETWIRNYRAIMRTDSP